MLSDFFDTMGTAIGLGREANLLDAGRAAFPTSAPAWVDSTAAAVGGAFSASSNTAYIESGSGIADGGRTGLTAVVVRCCSCCRSSSRRSPSYLFSAPCTGFRALRHPRPGGRCPKNSHS